MADDLEIPDRRELVMKVVGLCNRIPGTTTWNAAEWMYDELSALLAERRRSQAVTVPEGWVLVPKEPTEAMTTAMRKWENPVLQWEAALPAAPTPPKEGGRHG